MRSRLKATMAVAGLVATTMTVSVAPAEATPAQEAPVDTDGDRGVREELVLPVSPAEVDRAGRPTTEAGEQSAGGRQRWNIQVSRDEEPAPWPGNSGVSSPTIASADPFGFRQVAGWNDAEGFSHAPWSDLPALGVSGYGYSTNGGLTWTDAGAPPPGSEIALGPGPEGRSETGNYITAGHPWLDDDGRGTFWFANMAIWEDAWPPYAAGVSLHTGRFRGRDLSWGDPILLQSPNYPNDLLDSEALAVDREAVYVTVTNFEEVCGRPFFGFGTIELYRSLDAGGTWDRTVIQPDESTVTDPSDPSCGLDGVVNQGSKPTVGPDGEVHVVWERGWRAPDYGGGQLPRATIAFATSTDRGASFSSPVEVASICSTVYDPPSGYNRERVNDFPQIAVAKSGRHRGRIYVTYQDCSAASGSAPYGSDTDVYLTYSDDGGATWSTATPLHLTADGHQQLWPTVSVGLGGVVDVIYYDVQDINVTPDPDDIECDVWFPETLTTFSDVYHVRSYDGGRTWRPPLRLSDHTTNWCEAAPDTSIIPNLGDYNTSLSGFGLIAATWTDGRNADIDDRVPTIYFARR